MPKDAVIRQGKATWDEKQKNRKIAIKYAWVGFGWRGNQAECLVKLWTKESRFDHYAYPKDKNGKPRSSAYGIAQVLGETSRDPRVQILRGLRYISERHSTPCKAYNFALRRGHY